MTREEITQEILNLEGDNWLLELATGTGKSRIALEKIKSICKLGKLLIVVPRNVHKQNWEDEIKKWWPGCFLDITYTTYVSFPKHKGNYMFAIFDECHHLSERCREALCDFNINNSILLSATVSKNLKDELKEVFDNLVFYKKDLRDIIESEILPDPRVYLIPLELNMKDVTEIIWKNKSSKNACIECNWVDRWKYIKQNIHPVKILCTERQYYCDLESQIDYWKRRYLRTKSPIAKNKWLKLCGERLKWLSDKKKSFILNLLYNLSEYRTLTFCNSIEQTEFYGRNCINSKNKDSLQNLSNFNNGSISHITACNMLNEGMNLTDCQVGIYANLNSSETIVKQRMGRLLRHPNPIIIIPYYKNTRDEELVNQMMENYNIDLVTKIKNINELKL